MQEKLEKHFSIFSDLRNLQEQVKKAFCYQKLFWPFTVWINCSNDLKIFANSRPSASNFKSFSRSLDQFFLTVGQNNFGNKILFLIDSQLHICTVFQWRISALLFSIYCHFLFLSYLISMYLQGFSIKNNLVLRLHLWPTNLKSYKKWPVMLLYLLSKS